MEEIEIMGRPLAEIRRIIAWYESLGSPSLVETDQEREVRRKSYEEAKANYDAIPPNINANPLPTRSGETRQMYIPEISMGDRMRANLKETLDTYCPYLPRTEDATTKKGAEGIVTYYRIVRYLTANGLPVRKADYVRQMIRRLVELKVCDEVAPFIKRRERRS